MGNKYVYSFSEGYGKSKNILGGKGVGLAEMAHLKIPIPPGFTITTEVCTAFYQNKGRYPQGLKEQVYKALQKMERDSGMKFGDPKNPLLCSARSGARSSMPGMMETVLNIGLTSKTIAGMIEKTKNPRFVLDSYRRLIQMYSDVVMEKAEGIEPAEGMGVRQQLEREMAAMKERRNVKLDVDLTDQDLAELAEIYKAKVQAVLGKPFPDDANEQLWGAISAVFKSWNGKRAVSYRRIEGIPDEWGTAVNVQAMVFGNMGDTSATGVAFTRNPATGDNKFYGEWLLNAQGEDVVAGIRTPSPINDDTKNEQNKHLQSMQSLMPSTYKELDAIRATLEKNYHDMLDIEFTIQEKKLWMLQCRVGKRTGTAALNMAIDMLDEKLIDEKTAVMRVEPKQLDELLHPIIDPETEKTATLIVKGLPAGPGAASGAIVFTAEDAVAATRVGKKNILLREETNPEDVEGMRAASGILTARGGMTSHAALVARGWGKCCIVGAGALHVDVKARQARILGTDIVLKEGDVITLNGTSGYAYLGSLPMMDASQNPRFKRFMTTADKFRTMGVRTNSDTPEDAQVARNFGAEGIGLFRTEHMFYGAGSDKPLFFLRKMILSKTIEERKVALAELYPFVKASIKKTMEVMDGLPVTIRLLDPPLHEFVPQGAEKQAELGRALGLAPEEIRERGEELHESNPMMGHRGVRLGITYPEVTEMQIRAIFECAAELNKAGHKCIPEIMVPVTCDVAELDVTRKIVDAVHADVLKRFGLTALEYKYGTMIEIP